MIFSVNGRNYTMLTNENGTAGLQINLNAKTYNISYRFLANENYSSSSGTSKITVIQYNTTITSPGLEMIYGTKKEFVATLTDQFNNPLKNTEIYFLINTVTYKKITDNNGKAKITINLRIGNYPVSYYYWGNRTYQGSSGTNTLIVRDYNDSEIESTIISGNDTLIAHKAGEYMTITLTTLNNTPLVNQNIIFNVNTVDYTKTIDENGTASLQINLNSGRYVISYRFEGSGPYLPSNGQSILTVKQEETYLTGEDLNLSSGVLENFTLSLTNENNNPLKNTFVNVNIDNKDYSQFTDNEGKINIPLNLSSGIYIVNYSFNGNISYQSSKGSNTIIVIDENLIKSKLDTNTLSFNRGNGEYFITTLTDINNNPLVNQTVYYSINGRTYNQTTNSLGQSQLQINLRSGVYKMDYYWEGNEDYAPYSGIVTITVKNTTSLIGNDITYNVNNENYYTTTLISNNKALTNQEIIYSINNKNYTVRTDSQGISTIPIDLDIGSYVISYYYGGSENYSLTKGSSTITIVNTIATHLSGIDAYLVKGENRNYIVHLVDDKGQSIGNGIIDISVDYYTWVYYIVEQDWGYAYQSTSTYQVTTDSEGNGYLPISFDQGRYLIHSTFIGNTLYEPSKSSENEVIIVGLNGQSGQGNRAYKGESLYQYLRPSSNTQSSNSKIIALANSLTAGIGSITEQMDAIYNYVRNEIVYELYSGTRYGAVGTLERGSGNCVDQAHLLVALSRAVGIPARHVQGPNHVWTQVLNREEGVWLIADPTTERCWGLGFWNIYSIQGYYA